MNGVHEYMSITKYAVSICVPTYNRSSALARFLEAFVSHFASSDISECQLCVSDNASSDDTLKLLKAYSSRCKHIKYARNAENLGFGRNLYAAARLADGEHVFFCGDDDILRADALPLLVSIAAKNSDLVILNSYPGTKLEQYGFTRGQNLKFADTADYFSRLGAFHASYIGNLFFRRERFLELDPGPALALSAYPHMVPVFALLARGRAVFVNSPVVDWVESDRPWRPLQPVYTAVDMARLISENVKWRGNFWLKQTVYAQLIRSLPRAIWCSQVKKIPDLSRNPYGSVSCRNILQAYKPCLLFALLGAVLALVLPIFYSSKR